MTLLILIILFLLMRIINNNDYQSCSFNVKIGKERSTDLNSMSSINFDANSNKRYSVLVSITNSQNEVKLLSTNIICSDFNFSYCEFFEFFTHQEENSSNNISFEDSNDCFKKTNYNGIIISFDFPKINFHNFVPNQYLQINVTGNYIFTNTREIKGQLYKDSIQEFITFNSSTTIENYFSYYSEESQTDWFYLIDQSKENKIYQIYYFKSYCNKSSQINQCNNFFPSLETNIDISCSIGMSYSSNKA